MRKNRGFVALASAIALAAALFGGVSTALAATATVPQVQKQLDLNPGSTVSATFTYSITPKELSTGTGNEKTYTDGPAAAIADITLTDASSSANNTGNGAITFGGKSDASAFTHAGVYAWTIKENATQNTGLGTFQDDPQVYTLIATVVNGDNGLEFSSFVIVKGDVNSTTNTDKANEIKFDNKYTETTSENNTNLTITKAVEGKQGDKSKQFEFTVTFTAPSVFPNGQTAAQVLNAITATANGATDIQFADAVDGATTRTITFKAADDKGVTFSNVLVGTTYTVSETAVDGYTQSWKATANGTESTSQANLLIGENANNGTMTNTHSDVTPTGLVINNLPFIMLGCVAVAGVVAYGAAKRKLEK
ncbi:MAG: hypothetical protein K6E65_07845 [Olsenella sp.]|nr:hypothetical protein [Olsenella sp.]